MNIELKSFATIRMSVGDVVKSAAWYEKLFNCAPVEEMGNFASFKIAGACLDIVLADDKSPISKGGSVGYWYVQNFDEAIAHAIKLGAKIYRGPLEVPEINRIIGQVEDPYGNIIGFEGDLGPST